MENIKIVIQIEPNLEIAPLDFIELWNDYEESRSIGMAHLAFDNKQNRDIIGDLLNIIINSEVTQTIGTTALTVVVQKIIEKFYKEKENKDEIKIIIENKEKTKQLRIRRKNGKSKNGK